MKNRGEELHPLANIERNPLILGTLMLGCVIILFFAWQLLKVVNPYGFLVAVPGLFLAFQVLWLILHPFALIYEDKIEIQQSFIHKKQCYYVDLKKVSQSKTGKFYITYHDDEVERLNLFGIKNSHLPLLRQHLEHFITEYEKRRAILDAAK